MVVAMFAFAMICTYIGLLPRYVRTGNYIFNGYFIICVFFQIPMLHYMIVKQENKQQISRGRSESWVQKGPEHDRSTSSLNDV